MEPISIRSKKYKRDHCMESEGSAITKINDRVLVVELERKLAMVIRRNQELETQLENSRHWSRAWKRAAKSELDVVRMIRNLRRRRAAVGINGYEGISRERYETLEKNLQEALQQIEFLEKERQRWMENALFFQEGNRKMRLRLTDLESQWLGIEGEDRSDGT
jgi:phage shock protein A